MEKRDLDEMERISRKEEYLTVRCRPNWMYGFDGRQIMIAPSENGVLFVPIEDAERLLQEFSGVCRRASGYMQKITLDEKVRIAKEKGISYGKLLEMIERLGGRNESNIEKSPAGCRADTASDGR